MKASVPSGQTWSLTAICLISIFLLSMSADTDRTLRFIPDVYDFGKLREEDGKAEGHVQAVNMSQDTICITSVRTSCGCTGTSYTEESLAPGDTATISFTYNPANRPGKFEKTIKVFTGKERTLNSFSIKGNVLPSQESLMKAYPHSSGGLQLSSLMIEAGKVHKDELLPLFIGVYNPQEKAVPVKGESSSEALEANFIPETLSPGEIGSLTIVLKAKKFPADTKEFRERVFIIDSQTSDTLANIPVGGYILP